MAAEAAILADQIVPVDQLRGGGFGKPGAALQLGDAMVALEAASFEKPLGVLRKDPVVVVEPAVVAGPSFPLLGIVRRVRGPFEGRGASLPLMADGAAERLHPVRALRADEQVEPRMADIGVRQ